MSQALSFNERCRYWLRKIPKAPFVFLAFLLLLSCLQAKPRLHELTTHFKLQYFVGALCFAVLYALIRAWRWMFAALVCVLISGASFVGLYVKSAVAGQGRAEKHLRLLLSNVLYQNRDYQRVIALVKQEQPDLYSFRNSRLSGKRERRFCGTLIRTAWLIPRVA